MFKQTCMGLEASKYHEISHGQMQTILTSGWFILFFLCSTYRYVYYVDIRYILSAWETSDKYRNRICFGLRNLRPMMHRSIVDAMVGSCWFLISAMFCDALPKKTASSSSDSWVSWVSWVLGRFPNHGEPQNPTGWLVCMENPSVNEWFRGPRSPISGNLYILWWQWKMPPADW